MELLGALKVATAPAAEPVTLAEAKLHVRVDIGDDDTVIAGLITTARREAEKVAGRAFVTQTWDYVMDGFPAGDRLEIPRPPLQSITSITYYDANGAEATFSSSEYVVDTYSEPGRVVLKSGSTWPSTTLRQANGVIVRFVAGYGGAAAVPQEFKQAVLLLVGHWYENREATVGVGNVRELPMGVESLLWLDRVKGF